MDEIPPMDRNTEHFIERMGLQVEAEGLTRSAGRIAGYLLLQEEPRSLEEIAESLQISRASVSTNARLLERAGAVERVGRPGDRRDFYRIVPGFPTSMMGVWRQRAGEMKALMERSLEEIPEGTEPGRTRIGRMLAFYRFLLEHLEELERRWDEAESSEPAATEEEW